MKKAFQGWIASLNTGETIFETTPEPGELTPWQALLERSRGGNCFITQLQLQRGGSTVVAMTRRNPLVRGYFQAREARMSNLSRKITEVQGIGTIVGDFVYITWVNNQGQMWQDVRELGHVWMHTDMRKLVDII